MSDATSNKDEMDSPAAQPYGPGWHHHGAGSLHRDGECPACSRPAKNDVRRCAFCENAATHTGKRPAVLRGYNEYIAVCGEHHNQVDDARVC